jgi:hypothetical protein
LTEASTRNIDDALDEYVKNGMEGAFITGWITVASISSPEHDAGLRDGYITITSDGLQHHAQLGLLQVAQQDKQSVSMVASLGSLLSEMYDDGEEDD